MKLGTKRYNAAKPLQSANGTEEQPVNQPYDFLSFSLVQFSSTPSQPSRIRNFDDLDSEETSELANDGMVLWHVPDTEREDEPSCDHEDFTESGTLATAGVMIKNEMEILNLSDLAESIKDEAVVETILTGQ